MDPFKMYRPFTLLIALFLVACVYEGVKIFNEIGYDHYYFRLSLSLLTPLFALTSYATVVIISKILVPASFGSDTFLICVMITSAAASFLMEGFLFNSPKCNFILVLFVCPSLFWMFIPGLSFDSAGSLRRISLQKYSLRDHFTSEFLGLTTILALPPLAGFLIYRGFFLADSVLEKVCGWIIAQCSVLFILIIFFSSTLSEMCKVEKDIIYLTWTRRKIFSIFLPSMIRNSVLQTFVYPGCLLTYMALLDSSFSHLCFKLYYVCFVYAFRVFPSFNWAPCLSGRPRKHAWGSVSDLLIFELGIPNNYAWLLAIVSTFAGCMACSFIFQVNFGAVLFSFESFHAYIICRFLGTRIHAKAAIAQRETPFPVWDQVRGKYVLPRPQFMSYTAVVVV